MNVLLLLIFVCVVLVVVAVLAFSWTVRQQTFDHTDRLSLLPLEEEQTVLTQDATPPQEGSNGDSTHRLQR